MYVDCGGVMYVDRAGYNVCRLGCTYVDCEGVL